MSKVVFLDTGPLGILTNPKLPLPTLDAIRWSVAMVTAGHSLIVPAVSDFELRRELERIGGTRSLNALDKFNSGAPDRYLTLSDSALKLGAKLWGQARNSGSLPADPRELNGDVLIAAQALDYQTSQGLATTDIIIATVNVGHLALFVPADAWTNIKP